MPRLVGIDEAGFGPILGPLVVSSATLLLPRDLVGADLWQVLRKSVGGARKHLAGRILVADSKKTYSKSIGIKHLERTVLACLGCLGKMPADLSGLLTQLCPDCITRLSSYPWYNNSQGCAISVNEADITIASEVLQSDMAASGIELIALQSCCLDVAHYNRMVSSVDNKARVLFTAVSQLIKRAIDDSDGDGLQIIVDRQGGRIRYRRALQRMFPGMELKILREDQVTSSYELKTDGKYLRLHFAVGGDKRFFPVALASMVSKYLREILVARINRYFAGFHTSLAPTAGYWKDGLRFIEDLRTHLPHIKFDDNQLIRCR